MYYDFFYNDINNDPTIRSDSFPVQCKVLMTMMLHNKGEWSFGDMTI